MIKQTNSVQAKHAPLLSLFLNGYENMRQKMDAPCRRPLLEIAPLVFGKWYYAALAKETILSPANLFALDLQKDSDAKIEYAYIMNTKAAEEQSDLEFTSEYHFSLMTYSTQKHPLVADLQALISYCTPDRATDENGMLLEEEKKEILAIEDETKRQEELDKLEAVHEEWKLRAMGTTIGCHTVVKKGTEGITVKITDLT